MNRWQRRLKCHHDIFCCQYCDTPQCNGWNDPHLIARIRYRRRERAEFRRDEQWEQDHLTK